MADSDEIEALAGEYVLGTLDADERRAAEARIVADPTFRTAVADWERRLQPLAGTDELERHHGWITTRTPVGTSDQTSRISASVTATQPVVQSFAGWPTRNLRQPLGWPWM